jgi:hypothetical protein
VRSLTGVTGSAGGVSITAAALVAASALVMLLSGVQLWRSRRRWAARMVAFAGLLGGLTGLAVAGWVATDVVVAGGESVPQLGVYVLLVAGSVGALAGSAAARRLRPPLPTVPATGR